MWIEGRALYRERDGGPGRPVTVALDMRGLTVRSLAGEDVARWPFGTLVRAEAGRGTLVLVARGQDGRVEFGDAASAAAFDAALKAIPEAAAPAAPRRFLGCLLGLLAALLVAAAVAWWALDRVVAGLAGAEPAAWNGILSPTEDPT